MVQVSQSMNENVPISNGYHVYIDHFIPQGPIFNYLEF